MHSAVNNKPDIGARKGYFLRNSYFKQEAIVRGNPNIAAIVKKIRQCVISITRAFLLIKSLFLTVLFLTVIFCLS